MAAKRMSIFMPGKMLYRRLIVNGLNSNLRVLTRNPSAADDQIVLIKHRRLTGRDGALGCVQFDLHRTFSGWFPRCGRAVMVVTDFRRDLDWPRQFVEWMPVA